jgi:hypothetical protein
MWQYRRLQSHLNTFTSIGLGSVPKYNSEFGLPDGYAIDRASLIVGFERQVLIHALMGVSGMFAYSYDQGENLGGIVMRNDSEMRAAYNNLGSFLHGKLLRQGAILDNGTVWVERDDNQTMVR